MTIGSTPSGPRAALPSGLRSTGAALPLLIGSFAAMLGGCGGDRARAIAARATEASEPATGAPATGARAIETATHTAERALAYRPGEGVTDRAIAPAQEALRRSPDRIESLDSLAMSFLRRHRETSDPEHLRRAEDAVEAALVRAPRDPTALVISGFLAMQAHRIEDARAIAEELLRTDGDDAARAEQLHREDPRAWALDRARRGEDVGEDVEEAVRDLEVQLRHRHDLYTLAAHAVALARSGRHPEARSEMVRALALGTPDAAMVLDDALIRHLGGRFGGSVGRARTRSRDELRRLARVVHAPRARARRGGNAMNRSASPALFARLERELAEEAAR